MLGQEVGPGAAISLSPPVESEAGSWLCLKYRPAKMKAITSTAKRTKIDSMIVNPIILCNFDFSIGLVLMFTK